MHLDRLHAVAAPGATAAPAGTDRGQRQACAVRPPDMPQRAGRPRGCAPDHRIPDRPNSPSETAAGSRPARAAGAARDSGSRRATRGRASASDRATADSARNSSSRPRAISSRSTSSSSAAARAARHGHVRSTTVPKVALGREAAAAGDVAAKRPRAGTARSAPTVGALGRQGASHSPCCAALGQRADDGGAFAVEQRELRWMRTRHARRRVDRVGNGGAWSPF